LKEIDELDPVSGDEEHRVLTSRANLEKCMYLLASAKQLPFLAFGEGNSPTFQKTVPDCAGEAV